jgi:hypothetical protein
MSGFIKHNWKSYGKPGGEQGWECTCHGLKYSEKEYLERKPQYVHGSWVLNILAHVDKEKDELDTN